MAKQQQQPSQQQRRPAPAPAAPQKAPVIRKSAENRDSIFSAGRNEFIFGRQNFIYMGVGLLLVLAGLIAMTGGAQPNPNTWDENLIYSPRRITLAPMLMVAGFIVVIVGIFKKTATPPAASENESN